MYYYIEGICEVATTKYKTKKYVADGARRAAPRAPQKLHFSESEN